MILLFPNEQESGSFCLYLESRCWLDQLVGHLMVVRSDNEKYCGRSLPILVDDDGAAEQNLMM